MKKKKVALISAILVLLVLLLAGGLLYKEAFKKTPQSRKNFTERKSPSGEKQKAVMSFAWIYGDLPAITRESETIIKGKVIELLPAFEGTKPRVMRESEAKEAAKRGEINIEMVREDISQKELEELAKSRRGFIYTDTIVKVEKYYKNPLKNDQIIVRQNGGTLANVQYSVADLPFLEVGDEVILFLDKFLKQPNQDRYQIMGPMGLYTVKQDQVIRMINPTRQEQVTKNLSDFESEIIANLNK